jgi:hypothetical protein
VSMLAPPFACCGAPLVKVSGKIGLTSGLVSPGCPSCPSTLTGHLHALLLGVGGGAVAMAAVMALQRQSYSATNRGGRC